MMKRYLLLMFTAAVIALAGFQLSASSDMDSEYAPVDPDLASATFAGGCFWCVEEAFEKDLGVVEAVSGYSGGDEIYLNYQ